MAQFQWRLLKRIWRHEGGFQAAEKVAAIAVVLALLGALAAVFAGNGNSIGQTATTTIQRFVTAETGHANPGAASSGTVTLASLTSGVVGVPNLLQAQAGGQTIQHKQQSQQQDCGFLAFRCWGDAAQSAAGWIGDRASDVWNWTTARASDAWDWTAARASDVWNFLTSSEGIGAILGFIGAGIAVLAAVALGVFAGLPALVIAAIVGVALGLGALAGYLYVKITGRVDAWVILGLGFLVGGIGVVIGVWLAGGSAALVTAWGTITSGLSAAWSAAARVATTLARGAWTVISTVSRFVWRILSWPFRMAARGWRWLAKNLDTKFRPLRWLKWEIKPSDVVSNIIKLFVYAAIFKEIWVNGGNMPWWQWVAFGVFAVLSAYLPGSGFARVGMKAFYDFVSLWITGGVKFFTDVWDRLTGGNQPIPTPTAPVVPTPTTPTVPVSPNVPPSTP